jgi:hypothetical protein
MSLQNFIKTVWEANIQQSMRKALVAGATANTQYSGTLNSLGDKVKILQVSDPTISSYSRGGSLTYEQLDDAVLELIADQAYSFSFQTNDVDAVQQKPAILAQTTDKGAYGFAEKVDSTLLGLYAQAGLTSYSTGTTNWDVTSLNVEDVLLAANEKCARWTKNGRFMVVPPWFVSKLVLAGLTTKTNNDQVYANGFIDRVLGWNILESENVSIGTPSTGDSTRILCGIQGESFAYAGAISEIEALRLESYFSDAVRGLYVFGAKIIRPDKTLCIYADKTAEA